jgi:zinc D-Ala-D-Ala carboxypeptidase
MSKLVSLIVLVLVSVVGLNLWQDKTNEDSTRTAQFRGTHEFSTKKADSWWVVVNKNQPLNPQTYVPADLIVPSTPLRSNITAEESKLTFAAADAFKRMVDEAGKDGTQVYLQSGYRPYDLQDKLYGYYIENQGQSEADSYSAKPGYSEHQTGLAVDVGGTSNQGCNVKPCFAETSEASWLNDNAHKYGFILRYPKGKQAVTGYEYEPWHFRYVGVYLATQMKSKNISTMEEYFKSN